MGTPKKGLLLCSGSHVPRGSRLGSLNDSLPSWTHVRNYQAIIHIHISLFGILSCFPFLEFLIFPLYEYLPFPFDFSQACAVVGH